MKTPQDLFDLQGRTAVVTGGATGIGRIAAETLVRAEDIAGAMLFLCGRGGSYVTGAVIPVSGGINVQTGGNIFAAALE